jgi:hypothetical protein
MAVLVHAVVDYFGRLFHQPHASELRRFIQRAARLLSEVCVLSLRAPSLLKPAAKS